MENKKNKKTTATNAFELKAMQFSDEELMRIARDHYEYSSNLVKFVNSEMKKRGLELEVNQNRFNVRTYSITEIKATKERIAEGIVFKKIIDELQLSGYSEKEAKALVDIANRSKKYQEMATKDDEDYRTWPSVGSFFLILFLTYKIAMYFL